MIHRFVAHLSSLNKDLKVLQYYRLTCKVVKAQWPQLLFDLAFRIREISSVGSKCSFIVLQITTKNPLTAR